MQITNCYWFQKYGEPTPIFHVQTIDVESKIEMLVLIPYLTLIQFAYIGTIMLFICITSQCAYIICGQRNDNASLGKQKPKENLKIINEQHKV